MDVFLWILVVLLVVFIGKQRSPGQPNESHALMYPELKQRIDTANTLIERFDATTNFELKRTLLPEIEREVQGILMLSPNHASALQLQAMLPEMKRKLTEAPGDGAAEEPEYSAHSVDNMRAGLQKTAYGMVGNDVCEEDKQQFKHRMTEFASADPLVRKIAERTRAIVSATPGLLQSRIYGHFPEHSTEEVRYALYFAHELGWIYRRKKGNSYQLFPPGDTIDA